MKYIPNKTNRCAANLCAMLLITFSTIATSLEATEPDENLLDSKAGRSTQLYVEPGFNFETHKSITLDLAAFDAQGDPLVNTMIFAYSLPDDDPLFADVGVKSLIGILKTDDSGKIYQELEVPATVPSLSLEIRHVGMEGVHQADVTQSNLIVHTFYE